MSEASEGEPDTPKESVPFPTLVNAATQTEDPDLLRDVSSQLHLSLDIGSSPANVTRSLQSKPGETKEKLAVLRLQLEDKDDGSGDAGVVSAPSVGGIRDGGMASGTDFPARQTPTEVVTVPSLPAIPANQSSCLAMSDAAVQTSLPLKDGMVQTDPAPLPPLQHSSTQTTQCPDCYFSELDASFLCGHRNHLKVTTEKLETVSFFCLCF